MNQDVDLKFVDEAIDSIGRGPESVIALLQAIQTHYRYLPPEALEYLCDNTDITPARVTGVSTFYTQFRHKPVGKHMIGVCHGTACHVKGAQNIHDALDRHLGLTDGEDTDADELFTVHKVACLGCCTLAPAVQIDHLTYGHLTPDTVGKMLHDFLAEGDKHPGKLGSGIGIDVADDMAEVRIGLGSCCVASGSEKIYRAMVDAVERTNARAVIKPVGCIGMCHRTPMLELVTPDRTSHLYAKVDPQDAEAIIRRHIRPPGMLRRFTATLRQTVDSLLTDQAWGVALRRSIDARDKPVSDFLSRQKHIATECCGYVNPVDIEEYIAHGGFEAMKGILAESDPEATIDTIVASGLRGRGGAGFPTGRKWREVAGTDSETRYIVCNGDEGDPGAFMDRMILESYPYRVIEGMVIASKTVGARQGYLYIRAEYPLAVRRVRQAIEVCMERGLLGGNILDSGHSLTLKIMEGAGAFVCGEETALLASIEGRRGMPALRPPFPAHCGLWGKPTLVNNTETFAVVPWIIRNGPEAFARMGTETSKGTKVFSLAGKIARGGLIEVPMGITVGQIVEEIGGGIAGGKAFKAVQIGGPSGGCVPASLGDTTVDYEALTSVGAMMGSGGLVVLDESDCMVDITRYFLEFTQDQSCGQCTPCRIGTRRMLDILTRLCTGEGRTGDLERLDELARHVKQSSLCGLGKTAPNPVLSTLKYFREEYEAHLEGRCPAGRCKALITYSITDDCIGCTLCAQHCPSDAIAMTPYQKHQIDPEKCTRCDACKTICPQGAVRID
ncbi:MAG: NAD(P)H-dependent oxidoreductase subunit E [Phycisphaerae bacterium]|nr:NAD(P)H-dependent oxidoreductase subunit E [Phycisphaerae bacterium]